MRGRFSFWIFAFALTFTTSPAISAERVALVIGNGGYKRVPALPNPTQDAADISQVLERLGFRVSQLSNATAADMRKAIVEFGRNAEGSSMALVFYAGHGMEVGGENWLIPTDAELRSDADIESEAVSLRSVNQQVSKARQLGLVILDACRNNPFAAKMKRSLATRAVARGLVATEPTDNVLVAYAARDGTTASDGDGRNSPFTAALLRHLETPGLEISLLFRRVRDDVMTATKREQQPFVYGSLSKEEIYLSPRAKPAFGTAESELKQSSSSSVQTNVRDGGSIEGTRSGLTLAAAANRDAHIKMNISFSSQRNRPKPIRTHSSANVVMTVRPNGKIEYTYQQKGRFADRGTQLGSVGDGTFQLVDENTLRRTREFKDRIQTLTIAVSGDRCRATMKNDLKPGFVEWEGRSTELGSKAFYGDWRMTSSTCSIK
ncbi:caspase family protein [Bradyrhizobium sp. 44]|uniref:caspase family protein n=1 Tax=Bradyrhizobium sp. 44 TaxID=2782675 RepID=UPI001FF86CAF|nr:caspase family protein [Bradyrhizobium sp. 44]MCK1284098.1 caspase family protein [Bradyrhizobium sp. 44]